MCRMRAGGTMLEISWDQLLRIEEPRNATSSTLIVSNSVPESIFSDVLYLDLYRTHRHEQIKVKRN